MRTHSDDGARFHLVVEKLLGLLRQTTKGLFIKVTILNGTGQRKKKKEVALTKMHISNVNADDSQIQYSVCAPP